MHISSITTQGVRFSKNKNTSNDVQMGEKSRFSPFFLLNLSPPSLRFVGVISVSAISATGLGLSLLESDVSEMCWCLDLLISIVSSILAACMSIGSCGFISSTSGSLFIWFVSLGVTYSSSSSSWSSESGGGNCHPLACFPVFFFLRVSFLVVGHMLSRCPVF